MLLGKVASIGPNSKLMSAVIYLGIHKVGHPWEMQPVP